MKCTICHDKAELHHVYTRKASPELENEPYNLLPLCRMHHCAVHAIGMKEFANQYGSIRKWLQLNEWTLDPVTHKWENYELRQKQIRVYTNRVQNT